MCWSPAELLNPLRNVGVSVCVCVCVCVSILYLCVCLCVCVCGRVDCMSVIYACE